MNDECLRNRVKDMVLKLKRAYTVDRKKRFAMELASIQHEWAHKELFHMANGGHRQWLSWYGLEDQLIAIEALAECGTEQASVFLEKLLQEDVEPKKPIPQELRHYQGYMEYHRYHHARGSLRRSLDWCEWVEPGYRSVASKPSKPQDANSYNRVKTARDRLRTRVVRQSSNG